MALQYISDTSGKHTAVVIPISEWIEMTARHQDLKIWESPTEVSMPKRKPSDFRGSISPKTANELQEYVKQSKQEWDRDIS